MKCPACNTELAADARYCPHCGAPVPRPSNRTRRGVLIAILVAALAVIIAAVALQLSGAAGNGSAGAASSSSAAAVDSPAASSSGSAADSRTAQGIAAESSSAPSASAAQESGTSAREGTYTGTVEVTDFKAVAARKGVDLQATLGQSVVEENPSCVILWFDSEQEVQAYLPGASQTSGRSVPNVRLLGAESDWTAYDGQRVEVQPGTAYFVTDVAGMLYPVTFEDARVVRVL